VTKAPVSLITDYQIKVERIMATIKLISLIVAIISINSNMKQSSSHKGL